MAGNPFIQSPGGAKFAIGFLGLFHISVASLAIGFAFVVTALQIVGYRRKENQYDRLAKRIQLWHVCIYNIGTINAIGLVFALSGLYPQFWSQIFVQFFWTIIVEEVLFFMLATTLTLHYFFWDTMWGHKKLHIFLGSLMTPFFLMQFYIINGMGAYMLTPGFSEGQVSQWSGTAAITGWDFLAFYNPSFLMLTLHRSAVNVAYGGFFVAGACGLLLYLSKRGRAFRLISHLRVF
jgi:cytochrome bd-type quinol oxidase subunit 1